VQPDTIPGTRRPSAPALLIAGARCVNSSYPRHGFRGYPDGFHFQFQPCSSHKEVAYDIAFSDQGGLLRGRPFLISNFARWKLFHSRFASLLAGGFYKSLGGGSTPGK
jgi:hypothetical protein